MSLLCGKGKRKSKKKGGRDNSPAYGPAAEELQEEKARLARVTARLKQVENDNQKLVEEVKDEKNKTRISRQEAKDLKYQLKEATDNQDAIKAIDIAVTSSELPPAVDAEKALLSEELQSAKKDLDNERKQGDDKLQKIAEELKTANKALETERNHGESKVNKLTEELKQSKQEAETEKHERTKADEDRERLRREKDAAENNLVHTTKELELAKKESHIPRSPTKAPSEEWKFKIENAEGELQKERDQRLEKERENSRLNSDKVSLEKDKQGLADEIESIKSRNEEEIENLKKNLEMNHKNDSKRLEDIVDDFTKKLTEADAAKEKLLTRLSAQTAAQVLDNNPNVSDLSDPNRPQKLGEQLAQVYDDQWTDATEALEKLDKNEEDILKTLLDLVIAAYKHCKEAAESQLSRIEEDLFLPPLENASTNEPDTNGTEYLKSPISSKRSMSKIPRFSSHKGGRPALPNISSEKKTVDNDNPGARDKAKPKYSLSFSKVKGEKLPEIPTEIRKGIKEYRKKVTKQVWPVIEKELVSKLRRNEEFDENVMEMCKSYISKCVELCWLMRVQDPPVSLSWSVPDDSSFNGDIYRAYTKTGSHVEYVVWPVMYLYEGGPILMKGVAQGVNQ